MNHPSESLTLCCYVNATNKIQVARITNIPNWYFERVVFPGQKLMFEARSDANLEIHSGMMASSILSDTIPCSKLGLEEGTGHPQMRTPADAQKLEYRNDGLPVPGAVESDQDTTEGDRVELASLSN